MFASMRDNYVFSYQPSDQESVCEVRSAPIAIDAAGHGENVDLCT
jgi:hypothetical protein